MQVFLFLRSLLFVLCMAVITFFCFFACLLASPFSYRVRYWVTSRWNVMVTLAARVICGIRYEVRGMENLPDEPVILLSKHQSAYETIAYLVIMPRPLVFVFKKELLYIPFFGWGMALLRMIPINRSKGTQAFDQVVKHGKNRLANGNWIIMFPEGTRIPVGKKGKYKYGGSRLAVETNVPVVPIAVNSGECWPKNSFIKKPGTITISIGKPIPSHGVTPTDLNNQVENWIESEMRVISSPGIYKD